MCAASETLLLSPTLPPSIYFNKSATTTPPKQKRSFVPDSRSSGIGEPLKLELQSPPPKLNFASLEKEFGYREVVRVSTLASPSREILPEHSIFKRRKLDFIGSGIPAPNQSSETTHFEQSKEQAPKKKTSKNKSVTARAIARYVVEQPTLNVKSLPNVGAGSKKIKDKPAECGAGKAPRKLRKPRKKPSKESEKARASDSKNVQQMLVSPKQHSAKLQRQDILFGTSSQLNINEPASYIRDIQQAFRESEATSDSREHEGASSLHLRKFRVMRRTTGGLWGKGAQAQEYDLKRTQASQNSPKLQLADFDDFSRQADVKDVSEIDADDKSVDIDTLCPVKAVEEPISRERDSAARTPPSYQPSVPFTAPIFRELSFLESPIHSRTALRTLSTNSKPSRNVRNTSGHEKAAAHRVTTSKFIDNQMAEKIKKPRGRPRKTSQEGIPKFAAEEHGQQPISTHTGRDGLLSTPTVQITQIEDSDDSLDEIVDFEVDCTPTPPKRQHARPPESSILPLSTVTEKSTGKRSNTAIVNNLHPRWPDVQARLFPEISRAVKNASSTTDFRKPNWYERMLMYDPIVLEDFTAWLNEQGLRIEGKGEEMAEISAWMAQIWCEQNSVCCLWREGLRGRMRTKY